MSIFDDHAVLASTDDVFQKFMNPRWAEFSTDPVPGGRRVGLAGAYIFSVCSEVYQMFYVHACRRLLRLA
jgi:hypothetical protein